ncbi:RluA family pseudouridine synthase [Staphylococcus pasteuri]|uniref:RluA family pseudouridine synthase n=1 Tax=Staphylococcus TaxID=1279 RepID=UPI00048B3BDB|nr:MULTISPECIES: RluA family pseudouridine synthase [Staphylococcus]RQX26900.1 RluA family pseudouridine synthase [Staphylococcus warneri]MBL3398207.1 RluA family pseudouridine synthase [Staphylococcus pasteuri]MCO0862144.1 RluA family pseudouridine synthase [Staphylococcus pasteuri]MCO5358986.1 RluA family pseudouridine synthase [Staphylococcus pasteuri]MCT1925436.1 RluA family pseudouridine synthase [Staphylococcus pasteuri]
MIFRYTITQKETLKTFLKRHDFSKKTISAIKTNGALLVNNKPVTVRFELDINDKLEVRLPKEVPSANLVPYLKPLDILFEDDYIIIVFKPNGQNCAPSREHPHESLVEQVLGYLQDKGENTNPHIVTRLDRNTTGIVLFAKYGYIHYLFSKINMNKKYICLAHGLTKPSDVIEAPISRTSHSIIERQVSENGKYAKTIYQTIKQKSHVSLCEVQLCTGRTHQIRVHFQHLGHPLIGDTLYGGKHDKIEGQCLQCYKLTFEHPVSKNTIEITTDYKQLNQWYDMI